MSLSDTQLAAIGGAVGGVVVTGLAVYLKVKQLSSQARMAQIQAEVEATANAAAEDYLAVVFGLTPARMQALQRRFG